MTTTFTHRLWALGGDHKSQLTYAGYKKRAHVRQVQVHALGSGQVRRHFSDMTTTFTKRLWALGGDHKSQLTYAGYKKRAHVRQVQVHHTQPLSEVRPSS
jgi:hypothetical protein